MTIVTERDLPIALEKWLAVRFWGENEDVVYIKQKEKHLIDKLRCRCR
jgi:hypothetical protein